MSFWYAYAIFWLGVLLLPTVYLASRAGAATRRWWDTREQRRLNSYQQRRELEAIRIRFDTDRRYYEALRELQDAARRRRS